MSVTMTGVEVRLGPVDEIPLGEGRAYAAHGQQVAVFRLRNGSVRALSAACPHRGGPLADGQVDDVVVMCPLHSTTFELATGCSPSGERPARVHPVRVDDAGLLVVTVPSEPSDGSSRGPSDDQVGSAPPRAPDPGPTRTPLATNGAG